MADSTPRNESITEILPKTLGEYLIRNVEGLKDFYDEFPAPNRSIEMPSVSILFQSPTFLPQAVPYPATKPIDPNTPPLQNQVKQRVKWVVGQYDGSIQLDLWTRNKEERDDLTDAIFNALNPKISPMGLTLEMEEYFGQLADFLYTNHEFEDSEISSQTDEWRTIFTLLVTCKAVRERKEYVIEESTVDLETSTTSTDDPFTPA